MRLALLVAATACLGSAASASAAEVTKRVVVKAPAEQVWKAVGDFCGIADWHPAIEKCEIQDKNGKTHRLLTLKEGVGTILERQISYDEGKRRYRYAIVESPLPVDKYTATLAVRETKRGGTTILWRSRFEPKNASEDEAKKAIGDIYEAGLNALKEKVGK